MSVKFTVRMLFGDAVCGIVDYYRFPARRSSWGGPFNGQQRRQELFSALIKTIKPAAIMETGTHLGTTTEFMADSGIPVYSVESNRRLYGFACARLWLKRHVTIRHGDSRQALRAFFAGPFRLREDGAILAYLDAHWNDDLPQADELEIIFQNCQAAVVMIDDFEVPGDQGYLYDNFGPGRVLNAGYIASVVESHDLAVFYPSVPSWQETGVCRGCVVLSGAALGGRLESIPLLCRDSSARRDLLHREPTSGGVSDQ
jgi:hypothetical protein